jgi:hypothetical protein
LRKGILASCDTTIVIAGKRLATTRPRYRLSIVIPRQTTLDPLREPKVLRDDPERGEAEPEIVAHRFTQAGLDVLAIEWWGKAGDQALRRSAFQEAIAHLGKAIAMADKAGGAQAEGVLAQPRLHLHVAYGNALIAARGYGAPETTDAFVRAQESTATALLPSAWRPITVCGSAATSVANCRR